MKRLAANAPLLIFLSSTWFDDSWAFEGKQRTRFGIPPRPSSRHHPHLRVSSQQPEPFDFQQQPDDPERRKLLLSSAAAFASAFAVGRMESAEASTTLILEESENRRIDIFEKCAPSVVFIDTFIEKQDAFSTNSIEVPIGTGSGFVWDKEGHIGKTYLQCNR